MLTFQSGLTDFRRVRFSATSQFLVVADGTMGRNQEGYEVWSAPEWGGAVYRASDTVLRGVEWHPVRDELYVPRSSFVDIVAPTGRLLEQLPEMGWVEDFAWSPDGDWLLTQGPFQMVGSRREQDRWLRRWSVTNPTTTSDLPEQFQSVASFPDGQRLVVLVGRPHRVRHSHGGSILVGYWLVQRDFATGEVLAERPLSTKETPLGVRRRLAVLPDRSAVIGYRGRSVHIWPTDATQPARRVTVARKDVWDVALHPSGRWLVTVCDGPEVSVWDTTAWKLVRSFDWRAGALRCVAVSPDGALAAAGGRTGKVVVWDWDL